MPAAIGQEGRSAVVALSRIILAIHGLTDLDRGITTNVAPVWGGTRPNVIPPEAGCRIDFRAPSLEAAERVVAAIRALAGRRRMEGIRISIEGGINRPPFPETPAGLALFETARDDRRAAGLQPAEAASRRRLGRQFHRRHGHPDPGRAGLHRRRGACAGRTYPLGRTRAALRHAVRTAGNPGIVAREQFRSDRPGRRGCRQPARLRSGGCTCRKP